MNTQHKFEKSFSFEFFPPRTEEGAANLRQTREELNQLGPKFYSVTFGAGGSTRDNTYDTVKEMRAAGLSVAPHLSCVGGTKASIKDLLDAYIALGVDRIVALRGDLPSGMRELGELRYANELVEFIRSEYGNTFAIEVAAYPEFHPQASSSKADLDNFARKVKAGADSAITQYFYNADSYYFFLDEIEKRGVDIPVIPGIMPITNYVQLARFSDMCGAEIPRWLRKRLEAYGDDLTSLREFGMEVVVNLCEDLLANDAPGLHFYTMNKTEPTRALWQELDLGNR